MKLTKKLIQKKNYSIADACNMIKNNKAKFDESVDISINLGIDPKHADQNIRGSVFCLMEPAR